jgi:ribosome-associated protein
MAKLYQSIHAGAETSFSRSGGPGGQNVNKVNTKATLRLDLNRLEGLSANEIACLKKNLASRLVHQDDGSQELIVSSREERSQKINLERAYIRLEALIAASARIPKHRRPTKPSKAAREKRLKHKHVHSDKKRARQHLEDD